MGECFSEEINQEIETDLGLFQVTGTADFEVGYKDEPDQLDYNIDILPIDSYGRMNFRDHFHKIELAIIEKLNETDFMEE